MRSRFWAFPMVLLAMVACIDNNDYSINSVEVSPSIALPLISGELSVKDLIKNADSAYVKIYPDDLVYLAYSQELVSQGIRELFAVPDKSLNRSFLLPPAFIPAHPSDIRSDSIVEVVDFGLSPEQLSEISFKAGTIDYATSTGNASLANQYEINVSLPDFISKTTNAPFNLNIASTGSVDLSDYKVVMNKNKFNLKLVLVLKGNANPILLNSITDINLKLSFLGMDFSYLLGFFGDQTVSMPSSTVEVGTFGSALNGADVSFAQPKISLVVTNENGVPCQVDFKKFEAQKGTQKLAVIVSPANPVSIDYPAQLGESSKTSVSVVNVKELLDFNPTRFFYQVDARINQGLITGNNFLADTSKLQVSLNVEVPLYGRASNIQLLDTIKIDLSNVKESTVNSAFLKTKILNELPLDATVQFYLTDDTYKVLDSLLSTANTAIVKGSSVTALGDLASVGVFDQLIPLDKSKIDKIFTAKYILVKASMSTSKDANGAPIDVQFKSKFKLKVDLGLLANLNINVGI